jgi:hypothetical protein
MSLWKNPPKCSQTLCFSTPIHDFFSRKKQLQQCLKCCQKKTIVQSGQHDRNPIAAVGTYIGWIAICQMNFFSRFSRIQSYDCKLQFHCCKNSYHYLRVAECVSKPKHFILFIKHFFLLQRWRDSCKI